MTNYLAAWQMPDPRFIVATVLCIVAVFMIATVFSAIASRRREDPTR